MSELLLLEEWDNGEEAVCVEWSGPQTEFLQCTYTYPLFVGGFGSGKSVTMAGAMMRDLLDFPGANIAAYCPSYDLLSLITVPFLLEFLEEMQLPYRFNKSRYIIDVEGYGQFILRSMDNPSRIVGYQTFRAHADELDVLSHKKAEESWNKIIARNRQKIYVRDDKNQLVKLTSPILDKNGMVMAEIGDYAIEPNRVSAYTTPEGFRFVYERWVKNPVEGYGLIKAPTYTNKHLPHDYINNLRNTYPAQLVEAYIEGDFVNLTGKRVYQNYDRVLNSTDQEPTPYEILYVGIDFNVVHGAAVIHIQRDFEVLNEETGLIEIKQGLLAIDEIHDSYDTDETISILNQRYPNRTINVYPDATGTKRTSNNTAESDIKKLAKAKFHVFHNHSNPAVKDRVNSYNAMICNGKGVRLYLVNVEKCPNLVNSFEQQIWTENGVPDKSTNLDHIVDGGGYCVNFMFGITKPENNIFAIRGGY